MTLTSSSGPELFPQLLETSCGSPTFFMWSHFITCCTETVKLEYSYLSGWTVLNIGVHLSGWVQYPPMLPPWTHLPRFTSYKFCWWRWVVNPSLFPFRAQELLWERSPRSSFRNSRESGQMMSFPIPHLQLICVPFLRIPLGPLGHSLIPTFWPRTFLWTGVLTPGISTYSFSPYPFCITALYCPKYGFHLSYLHAHKVLMISFT